MMKDGAIVNCNGEIQKMMGYVRSTVAGAPVEFDVIDQRAIKAVLRQPLETWLLKLSLSGCKIRGTKGNLPRDVLALIEAVRVGMDMSKQELARRSGISRGHVHDLLADPDPRPHVETVVRLAVGLDHPLEVVGIKEDRLDDADPVMPRNESSATRPESSGGRPTSQESSGWRPTSPESSGWRHATTFSGTMFGGSVLPMLLGGNRAAYAGLGLIGAATVGVGARYIDEQRHRETAYFIGAGLIGAAVFGLIRGTGGGTP